MGRSSQLLILLIDAYDYDNIIIDILSILYINVHRISIPNTIIYWYYTVEPDYRAPTAYPRTKSYNRLLLWLTAVLQLYPAGYTCTRSVSLLSLFVFPPDYCSHTHTRVTQALVYF